MLIVAEILAAISMILLVLSVIRLRQAHRHVAFLRRVAEAVDFNPASGKYAPTLTEAEIAEFHSVRWDGD